MPPFKINTGYLITTIIIAGALALLLLPALSGSTLLFESKPAPPMDEWTESERSIIQSLSLANPQTPVDPSNQYAHNKEAIVFGTQLFFDQRLSRNGKVSCASCHKPASYFSDKLTLAMGQDIGRRNTPSLHGTAHNQWFFWDGRKDSLWSQALAPLENQAEHDFSRTALTKLILGDPSYSGTYEKIFGKPIKFSPKALPDEAHPNGNIEQIKAWKSLSTMQRKQVNKVFVNAGKAIAAYVTTLKPLTSRFDDYARTVQTSTQDKGSALLSTSERKGLRLFMGSKAGCINCHSGPLLTNQSFHNIGSGGKGDSGRAAAISMIRFDPFNCLGEYSDASENQCQELRFMQRDRHQLLENFKTPSLRNVSNTPPYFHDGRYQTLADVIDHYTNAKSTGTHLPAIELSAEEKLDLLAFLKTLAASQ